MIRRCILCTSVYDDGEPPGKGPYGLCSACRLDRRPVIGDLPEGYWPANNEGTKPVINGYYYMCSLDRLELMPYVSLATAKDRLEEHVRAPVHRQWFDRLKKRICIVSDELADPEIKVPGRLKELLVVTPGPGTSADHVGWHGILTAGYENYAVVGNTVLLCKTKTRFFYSHKHSKHARMTRARLSADAFKAAMRELEEYVFGYTKEPIPPVLELTDALAQLRGTDGEVTFIE